jgi:hypothetical protein
VYGFGTVLALSSPILENPEGLAASTSVEAVVDCVSCGVPTAEL